SELLTEYLPAASTLHHRGETQLSVQALISKGPPPLLDFVGDSGTVEPVVRIERCWRPNQGKLVINTVATEWDRDAFLGQHFRHGAPEATGDVVFLDYEDAASLSCCGEDRLTVQRLDGVHIDQPAVQPLGSERLDGVDRRAHGKAVGDDRQIPAVA